jgi:hypothetical protein
MPVSRKMKKRIKYNRDHSLDRVKERYSSQFKEEDILQVNSKIKKGNFTKSVTLANNSTVYEVLHKGKLLYPVFSKARKIIITFLPQSDKRIQEYFLKRKRVETKKIYRIEDPITMNGMWYDKYGNFKPRIQELCPNSISKDLPMEYCEDHRRLGKKWNSAGKSIENMNRWFSKSDAENLVNNGFRLYEFVVNDWYEKDMEILFHRGAVVSQKEIPINEVWK